MALKVKLKNKSYQVKVLSHEEFDHTFGVDVLGITVHSSKAKGRWLYFREDATRDVIAHELMHVLIFHSKFYNPEIKLDQKEEVVCDLVGDNIEILYKTTELIFEHIKELMDDEERTVAE